MAEYYYFVSSLPSIWMEKDAPISYEKFLQEAEEQMSKSDYKDLLKATFTPDMSSTASNKIVRDWSDFIFKLNETLTEARARKLGLNNPEYNSRCEKDSELESQIKRVLEQKNPLEAERLILSLYFDFLDRHPLSSPFSSEALMIYGLKLQIKEKEKSFDREQGRAEFDKLFKNIQKDIFDKE